MIPGLFVGNVMQSEGHRANIMNPGYTDLGVGIAQGQGGTYWVQNFGGGREYEAHPVYQDPLGGAGRPKNGKK